MMEHSSGLSFQNRYPYSGKIICEEHNTTFHRQVLTSKKGQQEVWQCKVYRKYGRSACSAPQIRSSELDLILSRIFTELVKDKQAIIDNLITVLQNVPKEVDYEKLRGRVQEEMDALNVRKDRLLDLQIAGAITIEEFKTRNDTCNEQLRALEAQMEALRQEEAQAAGKDLDLGAIRRTLEKELSFSEGVNSALVSTILEKIVVKKESTKEEIYLDIYLKLGQQYAAIYDPKKSSASITRAKNTTPRPPTRRI